MMTNYQAIKVTDKVYWVGAIDWSIRDFHGYSTEQGTTYNAFLVIADKITLIDTVKAPFAEEMLARIASVIDPAAIDYIICNHAEPDHSGSLKTLMEVAAPERVVASEMGVKALRQHFGDQLDIIPVADGQTLSLGNLDAVFYETRMLHWPDSMFTYLAGENVLFSSDAFGMHLASSARFDDQIQNWEYEAAKYFANILLPFAPLVKKLLKRVSELNLPLKVIAPDHGPIWRRDLTSIISCYAKWANQQREAKAVVLYDTMWQSTHQMARGLGEGLAEQGLEVKLMHLGANHRSNIVTELLNAGAVVVGSPTLNNNLFPTVAEVLTYLRGLRPTNLLGLACGSYGWSGEAVGQIEEYLKQTRIELLQDGLRVQYVPTQKDLHRCFEMGQTMGAAVQKRVKE